MRSLRKLLILLAAVAIGLPPARGECACQPKQHQQKLPACCQAKIEAQHDCCGGKHEAPCNCPGCECSVKSAPVTSTTAVPQVINGASFAAYDLPSTIPSFQPPDAGHLLSAWQLVRGPTLSRAPHQLFCVWII